MISDAFEAYSRLSAWQSLWTAAANCSVNRGLAGPAQIVIKDFMFAPNSLTVKAGSTVTWANKDDEPHTVVSDTGLFRSGAMDTDESFYVQIRQAGNVSLYLLDSSAHGRNDRR